MQIRPFSVIPNYPGKTSAYDDSHLAWASFPTLLPFERSFMIRWAWLAVVAASWRCAVGRVDTSHARAVRGTSLIQRLTAARLILLGQIEPSVWGSQGSSQAGREADTETVGGMIQAPEGGPDCPVVSTINSEIVQEGRRSEALRNNAGLDIEPHPVSCYRINNVNRKWIQLH